MDKEKKIEEMANIIKNAFIVYFGANDLVEPEDFSYQAKDLAKELLEHYQVVDKDSVVLSKEEWECLHNDYAKALYNARQNERKETAENILAKGEEFYKMSYHKGNAIHRLVEWIKDTFDVEIKE